MTKETPVVPDDPGSQKKLTKKMLVQLAGLSLALTVPAAYALLVYRLYRSVFFYVGLAANAAWCLMMAKLVSMAGRARTARLQETLRAAVGVVGLMGLMVINGTAARLAGSDAGWGFFLLADLVLPSFLALWVYLVADFARHRRRPK